MVASESVYMFLRGHPLRPSNCFSADTLLYQIFIDRTLLYIYMCICMQYVHCVCTCTSDYNPVCMYV